jgi:DNA-binding MarR family transcriptional regulator
MEDNDPRLELFHRLRRVSVAFELSRAEFARLHGLHPTDLRALIALLDAARDGRRATPGWLGAQLDLNSAGTTTLADRLERLGLIRRVRDTRDRRKVFLEVTDRAADTGWAFFGPVIHAAVAEISTFSSTELAAIERFLDSMIRITQSPDQSAAPAGGDGQCGWPADTSGESARTEHVLGRG